MYNYTKPFDINTSATIEHNRNLINIEAKYSSVRPEFINSIPIPTTPITGMEARTLVNNARRIQNEHDAQNLWSSKKSLDSNSNESNTSTGCDSELMENHPFLGTVLFLFLAASPLLVPYLYKVFTNFF